MDPAVFDIRIENMPPDHPARPMIATLQFCLQRDPTMTTDAAVEDLMDNIATLDKRDEWKRQEWLLAESIADTVPDVPRESETSRRLLDIMVALFTSNRWPVSCDFSETFMEALAEAWKFVELDLSEEPVLALSDDTENDSSSSATSEEAVSRFRNFVDFYLKWKLLLNDRPKAYTYCVMMMFMRTLEADPVHKKGYLFHGPCDGLLHAASECMILDGRKMYEAVCARDLEILSYPGQLWLARNRELENEGVPTLELPMQRWMFWKERLRKYGNGDLDTEEHRFSEEAKAAALQAVLFMEELDCGGGERDKS